jgi:hypothetical protein
VSRQVSDEKSIRLVQDDAKTINTEQSLPRALIIDRSHVYLPTPIGKFPIDRAKIDKRKQNETGAESRGWSKPNGSKLFAKSTCLCSVILLVRDIN